jgi:PAS domain S-box-containing protein
MGALIRATDWSTTPIGPIETWSPSLRMMVSFMLANRFPLLLWWGPQYVSIYNDAYRPILGRKHPRALGQPVSSCWEEIWHILKPLIDTPFHGGPATWMEDIALELNRHGFLEEAHFTIAYSPVPDETAPRGIGGVLATVHEITEKLVGERRVATLSDLGARVAEARTAEQACCAAAVTLARNAADVPFALIYLIDADGRHARLAGAAGVGIGEAVSPATLDLAGDGTAGSPWPVAQLIESETLQVVEDLGGRFATLPAGPWADPPQSAVLVPIKSNLAHRLAGFLIAGVSARLRLDDLYRSFFDLVAAQIATAVANARAYEEECRRTQALAEIDRAKTVFFSNVSHEFRTPLALMLGPLDDALASPALAAELRGPIDVAHRNALRLLKLVNSLLDFSRIEAGRVQASYQPVDLARLTTDLASNFQSAIERAGLALVIDCPPLPAPVHVDCDMWEKIVLNLISNAFKFTFAGEIAVRLRAADGQAELEVRDTGVGIPAHELPRLFERFHRVEGQRSRTYEGSGIGLALVQELVRLHGGEIRVASTVDGGTAFTVGIPLGTAHLPPARLGADHSLAATAIRAEAYVEEALRWLPDVESDSGHHQHDDDVAMAGGRGAQIVLADDNADMRAYVRRLLDPHHRVRTCADGEAALAAIRAERPKLVLTDVMMPGLDGFGLIRTIRADPALRDLPVIMLSARAGEEARIDGLAAGADDYLTKPFAARELLARVEANLKLARIRQEAAAALRRSEEEAARQRTAQFEMLLTEAPLGVYLVDADFRIRHVNPVARAVFGDIPGLIGRDFDEVIHVLWSKDHADEIVGRFRHTLATGEPHVTPERIQRRRDRDVTEYYEWQIHRIPLPDGGLGVVCYFQDVSAHVQARQRQQLLLHELNHRVKNTLATVQAFVVQTLRSVDSVPLARAALEARLVALAKAHDVLTREHWEGASLTDLVSTATAAYRADPETRIRITGPEVRVQPKAVLALSMALHELATNAVKYGALAGETGRVDISWRVEAVGAGARFRFCWQEAGGPPVQVPARRGFGSRLVERGLAQDLAGRAQLCFEPQGLVYTIDAPFDRIRAGPNSEAVVLR